MVEISSILTSKAKEDIATVFFINVIKIGEKTCINCYH